MFSTGQNPDQAVAYTSSNAVCGKTQNGQDPVDNTNAQNLTLPQSQNCPAPIGPKWVSAVTNWFVYLIDRAGLEIAPGAQCQNPLQVFNAVMALILQNTKQMMIMGPAVTGPGEGVLQPPDNALGNASDYFMERVSGNVWGPKHPINTGDPATWPTSVIKWGDNNATIGTTDDYTCTAPNSFIQIGAGSTKTVKLPSAVGPQANGTRMVVLNDTTFSQNVASVVGEAGILDPQTGTSSGTIQLAESQMMLFMSNGTAWIIVMDNFLFREICKFATPIGGSGPVTGTKVLGCDSMGNTIYMNAGDIAALADGSGGSTPGNFDPFTTTGVGAIINLTTIDIRAVSNHPGMAATFVLAGGNINNITYGSVIYGVNDGRWPGSGGAIPGSWQIVQASSTSADGTNIVGSLVIRKTS